MGKSRRANADALCSAPQSCRVSLEQRHSQHTTVICPVAAEARSSFRACVQPRVRVQAFTFVLFACKYGIHCYGCTTKYPAFVFIPLAELSGDDCDHTGRSPTVPVTVPKRKYQVRDRDPPTTSLNNHWFIERVIPTLSKRGPGDGFKQAPCSKAPQGEVFHSRQWRTCTQRQGNEESDVRVVKMVREHASKEGKRKPWAFSCLNNLDFARSSCQYVKSNLMRPSKLPYQCVLSHVVPLQQWSPRPRRKLLQFHTKGPDLGCKYQLMIIPSET